MPREDRSRYHSAMKPKLITPSSIAYHDVLCDFHDPKIRCVFGALCCSVGMGGWWRDLGFFVTSLRVSLAQSPGLPADMNDYAGELDAGGSTSESSLRTMWSFAHEGKWAEVKPLVESQPDAVRAVDEQGNGLIHWMALHGHYDGVKHILDKGGSATQLNAQDQPPIHFAIMSVSVLSAQETRCCKGKNL